MSEEYITVPRSEFHMMLQSVQHASTLDFYATEAKELAELLITLELTEALAKVEEPDRVLPRIRSAALLQANRLRTEGVRAVAMMLACHPDPLGRIDLYRHEMRKRRLQMMACAEWALQGYPVTLKIRKRHA